MKFNKIFLFLLSAFFGLIVVNATAQSTYKCAYTETEKYRIEEAIQAGKEDAFITWCCEELGQCHPGYSVYEGNHIYRLTHIAAKYNRPSLVSYFAKQRTNKDGSTSAPIPVDSFLLTRTCVPDTSSYTQLMLAVKNKGYAATEELLSLSASPTKSNSKGEDALILAKRTNDSKLISLVQGAWNKAMGFAQARVEKNKKDLIKVLTLNDIENELKNFKRDIKFNGFFG